MKKIIMVLLGLMLMTTSINCYSQITAGVKTGRYAGKKQFKNKATYGHSRGTYSLKPFYAGRKAPRTKSGKNMPSAIRRKN
jgi:hypothetical protein